MAFENITDETGELRYGREMIGTPEFVVRESTGLAPVAPAAVAGNRRKRFHKPL